MDEQDEMVKDFLVESLENLDRLDLELVELGKDGEHNEALNSIFRTVHTIKGTCGFFNFSNLEGLTHVGENLLDTLRSGKKKVTPEIINVLLALSDAIREMLDLIEKTGSSGSEQYLDLKALINHHNSAGKLPSKDLQLSEKTADFNDKTEVSAKNSQTTETLTPEQELEREFNEILRQRELENEQEANAVISDPSLPIDPPNTVNIVSQDLPISSSDNLSEKETEPAPTKSPPNVLNKSKNNESAGNLQDSSIRVDVNLLDELMNLVGELVLARNQLRQLTSSITDASFTTTFQRLNLITSELQEGVMKTRMQPILNVWNKFPRVVHDVAGACNKKVRLEMEGKDTELDKTIIEAIKDPMVHIVRNSIDHGIESPQERICKGKPEEGVLRLRAYHEGGCVIIEIADDGSGLKTEIIRQKAVEKGLISRESATNLNEQQVHKLIFLPGFSTAPAVTNLSGRGVGMDVVKSNIEKIGGTVEIESEEGKGSRLRIKIPLTLAIVPALIISCKSEIFAIPQVNLLELVRLDREDFQKGLETIKGAFFYRLRDRLLPLISLSNELRLDDTELDVELINDSLNIVVLKSDTTTFGLIVDKVHDTEEIVVKSLSKSLKSLNVFAGATIMGDGRVALILDVLNLALSTLNIAESNTAIENQEVQVDANEEDDFESLLIVDLGSDNNAAIPLVSVKRLEEFESKRLQVIKGQQVIQYREGILELVDLRSDSFSDECKNLLHVIVLNSDERKVGFIVEEIKDVVRESISNRQKNKTNSNLAIIQDKIMTILDLENLC
jgi:two-component system, chemotaxis family, sensor kinase CheA